VTLHDACDPCLSRALLLSRLAPYIERVVTGRAGSRGQELLALPDTELARAAAGLKADDVLARAEADDPDELRRRLAAAGCWETCRHRQGYPDSLTDLGREAPAALMGGGDPALLARLGDDPGVTVVGSRRGSAYGRGVARELGRTLAAAQLPVISGMALGIDTAAHRGALDGGGTTIAVLGSGPDRAYPPSNRRLHARIAEEGGLVISELPPGTGAFRWTFPARNRIMAALGRMTVVVEAAQHSGSLITVGFAQQLGRDVGAVPGPVNSWLSDGANALLVDGADPIRHAEDVLDRLFGAGGGADGRAGGEARLAAALAGPELDDTLAIALAAVEAGRTSPDEVAEALGGDAGAAASALTRLELLGYVASGVTGAYSRTALARPSGPS
jgi:DNA processing protein